MPTSAMLKKDEPPKQKVGSEEEDCTKNDSVFVKLALLQSKDVFVSCNNHCLPQSCLEISHVVIRYPSCWLLVVFINKER